MGSRADLVYVTTVDDLWVRELKPASRYLQQMACVSNTRMPEGISLPILLGP